eukprot:1160236-Pelagomonas_calceolata.AAC.3
MPPKYNHVPYSGWLIFVYCATVCSCPCRLCAFLGVMSVNQEAANLLDQAKGLQVATLEHPFLQQASVQDVSDFLLQHNNKLFSFVSELMDIMLAGEDQSQADQPNSLAEGPPV